MAPSPTSIRNRRPMLASAIRGFNREWTQISSIKIRDRNGDTIKIGWRVETACGVNRRILNKHFKDSYGAAIEAMETHRCRAS